MGQAFGNQLLFMINAQPCGSGLAREAGNAMDGTGFAGVRGQARSHKGNENPTPEMKCLTHW
ncbi:hypothetical protein PPUJ20028_01890 [Pseudomonas putida]|uniref:Uncharacterized protein n=1 Tax=Pseudomonas putida TaxID=303 RepID=A0AA37RDC7_PSEPU|nr:hypothetical protein PPUJ20028_01890 [Pseudomonas putida]GLO34419.1 hypothetical protein PPUN14671_12520 [Pseudomonas putida]